MTDARLPAHLEVAALLRRASESGGSGTVIRKGEREAGTILVLTLRNGANPCVIERMPDPEGGRTWTVIRNEAIDKTREIDEWVARRAAQDPDLWVIELNTAIGERFIVESGTKP